MIQPTNNSLLEPNKKDTKVQLDIFIDIHCHCLAGVDDGPATDSESLDICRALVADGIGIVIATPHQLGRFADFNKASQIRQQVSQLNDNLKNNDIALEILAGADIRVDERICELLKADEILTLADGGKYILLELPHEIFIDITPLLIELSERGIKAIISHPERHHHLAQNTSLLANWIKYSAGLQITSASLLGKFGRKTQKAAWQFLSSGQANFVATDCHNLDNRKPCMKDAFEYITAELGEKVARWVCIENPLRVLEGQDIVVNGFNSTFS